MEPGVLQVNLDLAAIHSLIDGCCRIIPRVARHKSECQDFSYFLKDVGNRLRRKISFPLPKKQEKALRGQLQVIAEKLRDAQTLLLNLANLNFVSGTTTDRIIYLRVEILMTLSIISLFMRQDEVDTFEDLEVACKIQSQPPVLLRNLQGGSRNSLAKFPPNWKPVHVKDKFELQILSPRHGRHRTYGHATIPLPCKNAVDSFSSSVEAQKVIDAISCPWELVKELGRGGYGTVWLAKDSCEKYFALKELHYEPPPNMSGISFERDHIQKLQELCHKHVVRYFGCERVDGTMRIFMELAGRRSLRAYYLEQPLKIAQIKDFTRQILDALVYVHSKKIVHRDVKCDNIIIDDSGTCKLVDFGVAKQLLSSADQAKTQVGSARWMAPEVIRPFRRPDGTSIVGYSRPADIWSLGCTVLEMCSGNVPFPELTNNVAVLYAVGNLKVTPDIPACLPEQMKDFLRRCLKRDPTERPTAQCLQRHPFIVGLPDLWDMWEAERARVRELSHPRFKDHLEATISKHIHQLSLLKSLTGSFEPFSDCCTIV